MSVHAASSSQFRVEKERVQATLTLSNGADVPGAFFVAEFSATHAGQERIHDVLNAEGGFFPFEVGGPDGARTVMYNRDHVVLVALGTADEARRDAAYDLATPRAVSMLLSNGLRLRGSVRVYRPKGRDRLSDFARASEGFRYLEAAEGTYLVNVRHLLELAEETDA